MASDQPDWTGQNVSIPAQTSYAYGVSPITPVPSGGYEDVTFLAPSGTYVIVSTFRLITTGITGATGTGHLIEAYAKAPDGQLVEVIFGSSNPTDDIQYQNGYWQTATIAQGPPATQPQSWFAGNLVMDDVNGLTFQYQNFTDLSQTAERQYYVLGTQVQVVPQ